MKRKDADDDISRRWALRHRIKVVDEEARSDDILTVVDCKEHRTEHTRGE